MTDSIAFTPTNLFKLANSVINHEAIELVLEDLKTRAFNAAVEGKFTTLINRPDYARLGEPERRHLIHQLTEMGFTIERNSGIGYERIFISWRQ